MPTSCIGEDEHIAPVLPTQFAADLHVISHLTDPSQEYPPSMRKLKIQYDFDQKMAKAVVLKGYDAGKTYVRRYDEVCMNYVGSNATYIVSNLLFCTLR
jgi:hypothetical protein